MLSDFHTFSIVLRRRGYLNFTKDVNSILKHHVIEVGALDFNDMQCTLSTSVTIL
jgi:hypothetical protein